MSSPRLGFRGVKRSSSIRTTSSRYVNVTPDSVGRNVEEVLRVAAAARRGELMACGWRPGDAALDVEELLATV